MSTKAQRLTERQTYLASLDVASLIGELGEPRVIKAYATTHGHWRPGEARPALADDRPEVMCAIARCGVSRQRHGERFGGVPMTGVHPDRCGWCDYPLAQLLAALDWSIHESRLVASEVWAWPDESYSRTIRSNAYEHPAYHAFAAMPGDDQRRAVALAVAASRRIVEEASPPREHEPWCSLAPDHDGECPEPSE